MFGGKLSPKLPILQLVDGVYSGCCFFTIWGTMPKTWFGDTISPQNAKIPKFANPIGQKKRQMTPNGQNWTVVRRRPGRDLSVRRDRLSRYIFDPKAKFEQNKIAENMQ